jgi:hypothetical protein
MIDVCVHLHHDTNFITWALRPQLHCIRLSLNGVISNVRHIVTKDFLPCLDIAARIVYSIVYSIGVLPLFRSSSGVSRCMILITVIVLLPRDKTHTVPQGCYRVIVAWRHPPLLFLLIYCSRFSSS